MCGPALTLRWPWPGRAVASCELHGACKSRHDRDTLMAAHAGEALRWPSAGRGRGGTVASRELREACPTRCDGDTPVAAHACAALRWPSAGRGRGGQLRRASCTGHVRLAAMVTLLWQHTHVLPGAGPPPAVAGEGGRVARATIGYLCTQPKFNILYTVANDKVWPCLGSFPQGEADGTCRCKLGSRS